MSPLLGLCAHHLALESPCLNQDGRPPLDLFLQLYSSYTLTEFSEALICLSCPSAYFSDFHYSAYTLHKIHFHSPYFYQKLKMKTFLSKLLVFMPLEKKSHLLVKVLQYNI